MAGSAFYLEMRKRNSTNLVHILPDKREGEGKARNDRHEILREERTGEYWGKYPKRNLAASPWTNRIGFQVTLKEKSICGKWNRYGAWLRRMGESHRRRLSLIRKTWQLSEGERGLLTKEGGIKTEIAGFRERCLSGVCRRNSTRPEGEVRVDGGKSRKRKVLSRSTGKETPPGS